MTTYHQLHAHLIFSTSGRRPLITQNAAPSLHGKLATILKEEDVRPHCIGGVEDHVHLLISFRPTHRLSDIVRVLKSCSSKWVNDETTSLHKFGWQRGYSVFSVSHSQLEVDRRYIENQWEHHRELSFREELVRFLNLHEIDYDPQYIDDSK